MQDLARKFGMILQTYCRICLQQCGELPNIHCLCISMPVIDRSLSLIAGELPNIHAGREAVRGQVRALRNHDVSVEKSSFSVEESWFSVEES